MRVKVKSRGKFQTERRDEVNFKPDAVAESYVGRVGGQKRWVGGWKSVKLSLIQRATVEVLLTE